MSKKHIYGYQQTDSTMVQVERQKTQNSQHNTEGEEQKALHDAVNPTKAKARWVVAHAILHLVCKLLITDVI